jgi:thiopeptide-type bacteriocin biosynthesis protein
MLSLDRLLGDCGVEGGARVDWLRRHAQLGRDDGTEYRARKDQLRAMVEADADAWHPIVAILERRRLAVAPAVAGLEALEEDATLHRPVEALLADLAHLHCNRMLGPPPREEQRILALLRRTREAVAHQSAAVTPGG